MDLPNELWYKVFNNLTQKSQAKFSCLWNLYNLSLKEIQLLWSSDDLWFDCAKNGYIRLIQVLIQNGANVNVQNKYGKTAIHLANQYGHKDCIETLLRAGADVSIQNIYGRTALHWASIKGHKDCLEVLIKNNVDVNVQDKYDTTALHYASLYGHKDCVELLTKACMNNNTQDSVVS